MNAFIINLSNIFDFDISMPILSGLVAEKRVWKVGESGAFPVNPSESLVCNKLFAFSNKYEHLRITLDMPTSKTAAELYLILGYEEWDFLPYGKLNAYSYFKIEYILDKLSELFKKPIKSLPFKIRVFLTEQANSEKHQFLGMIEDKGFCEMETSQWIHSNLIERDLSLNIEEYRHLITGKKADAIVDNNILKKIDQYYQLYNSRMSEFFERMQIPSDTIVTWKRDFKDRLDRISTIQHFTDFLSSPTSLIKMHLYNTFALTAHCQKLPPIYKYTIDTSSTINGLRTKFEYTQFITQFIIEPFLEEKNRLYKVEEIEINPLALSPMLCKMQGTIGRYKKKSIDLEKEEDYNIYTVNESYYRNLPVIDNEDRNRFYNLNAVRNSLGWFYNRRKKDSILRAFEANSYSLLENKIPVETDSFSSLLKDALNKQSKTVVARMIPSEITRLEQSRLASPIDFQHYSVEKEKLLDEQKEKIEELTKMLPSLPFSGNTMYSAGIVFLLMVLFCLPIFSGEYWENAILYAPVFLVGVIGWAYIALSLKRKKIHDKILEIEEVRLSLANNLSQHCTNIKTAATQMAEAFAKRETLKGLKKIQEKYDKQSYRYLAYENFHAINSDSLNKLSKIYNIDISGTDTSPISMSYDRHPEDDPNLINEFPINDIDVVMNMQQTPQRNIRTILKKIKIKSI